MASVTDFMRGECQDHSEGARSLVGEFFDSLVRYADKKFKGQPRCAGDGEDAALSAIHALCRQAGAPRFRALSNRHRLKPLLRKMARDKVLDMVKAQRAEKRGSGNVRGESVWLGTLNSDGGEGGIERTPGNQLPPDVKAKQRDWIRWLLDVLGKRLFQVGLRVALGWTFGEIAIKLKVSTKTVSRKVDDIRRILSKEKEVADA